MYVYVYVKHYKSYIINNHGSDIALLTNEWGRDWYFLQLDPSIILGMVKLNFNGEIGCTINLNPRFLLLTDNAFL